MSERTPDFSIPDAVVAAHARSYDSGYDEYPAGIQEQDRARSRQALQAAFSEWGATEERHYHEAAKRETHYRYTLPWTPVEGSGG